MWRRWGFQTLLSEAIPQYLLFLIVANYDSLADCNFAKVDLGQGMQTRYLCKFEQRKDKIGVVRLSRKTESDGSYDELDENCRAKSPG